jgi:hypothetical protein
MIRGAAFPVLQSILEERAPPETEQSFAALVLRMLGVTPDEAARIASLPLPEPADDADEQESTAPVSGTRSTDGPSD